ncbi:hypothetical protein H6504_03905 [Candidatus Woesearchaeota archaeon]|nr:hypothetical protein [Candidatus Woesearchaeota archaeon]
MRWNSILMVAMVMMIPAAYAELSVVKQAPLQVEAGQSFYVTYQVSNTYNRALDVFVVDNTTDGASGVDIACMALQLPASTSGVLDLRQSNVNLPIVFYEPGVYEIEATHMHFMNPDLGIVDEVVSESLTIEVTGKPVPGNRSIQQVFLCDEQQQQQQQQQQEQKEQQPSKEEVEQQIAKEEQARQEAQQEMQERYEQQTDAQKKTAAAQQNSHQDTSATKQALQKEQERRLAQEEAFKEALESTEEYASHQDKVFDQKEVETSTNSTGDFTYNYTDPQSGEQHSLQGKMENGSVTEMLDTKNFTEQEEYQQLEQMLQDQGFQPSQQPQLGQAGEVTQEFVNPQTGEKAELREDEELEVSLTDAQLLKLIQTYPSANNDDLREHIEDWGNYSLRFDAKGAHFMHPELKKPVLFNVTTGEVLDRPDFGGFPAWSLVVLLIVGVGLVILYLRKEPKEQEHPQPLRDIRKESMEYLDRALALFEQGKHKDAYSHLSLGIRHFYSCTYGTGSALTERSLRRLLETKGLKRSEILKAMEISRLVEYARYGSEKETFLKFHQKSVDIIMQNDR